MVRRVLGQKFAGALAVGRGHPKPTVLRNSSSRDLEYLLPPVARASIKSTHDGPPNPLPSPRVEFTSSRWHYSYVPSLFDGTTLLRTEPLGRPFSSPAGLFDGRSFVSYDKLALLDNAAHRQLALEAAEQSIVLLLNGNRNKSASLPVCRRPRDTGTLHAFDTT